MKIAIAGSAGFVGRHLVRHLEASGTPCKALSRAELVPERVIEALSGWDVLVNCIGEKSGLGERAQYANVEMPQALYEAARQARVKQFVHVSSVAAIASTTAAGTVAGDDAFPAPDTPYGISKLAGDRALLHMAQGDVALTILRPPILLGPDSAGVFAMLRRAAERGVPLPLAGLRNRRSFMHVANFAEGVLASARAQCGGTFITTDSTPMTPEELYRQMTRAAGHPARVFPIGAAGRAVLRKLLGRRGASLFDHAAFDGSRFIERTGVRWPIPEDRIVPAAMAGNGS